MSVIAKQSGLSQEQFRLIGKQLVAKEQQSVRLHIFKVAAVWAVLFVVLGLSLYLLRIDLSYIFEHRDFVLLGLWTTLSVSLISILAATILAFLGALGRLSTNAI